MNMRQTLQICKNDITCISASSEYIRYDVQYVSITIKLFLYDNFSGYKFAIFQSICLDILDDWKNYLLTHVSGTSVARIESLSSLICPTSLNENVIRPLC